MLQQSEAPGDTPVRRQPVLLLLGGGMAAGKSTVREMLCKAGFKDKVGRRCLSQIRVTGVVVGTTSVKTEGSFRNQSHPSCDDELAC